LLKQAGLETFENHDATIDELKRLLNEKYKIVNQRFSDGKNPYLAIREDKRILV
jgi:hypothetical protein